MKKHDLNIAFLAFNSIKKIGGAQVFFCNLAERLSRRGHRITFYVPENLCQSYKSFYSHSHCSIKPLLYKSNYWISYFPLAMRSYIYGQQLVRGYDVWHISGSYPGGYIATYLSRKVPLVLTTYGDDIQKDANLGYGLRLDRRFERIIRKSIFNVDRLVAISKSVRDEYKELGVPDERIAAIPYGLDLVRFSRPADASKALRARWNIPVDKTLILTVGRNHPKKDYQIIPKVSQILKNRGLAFIWLIIGRDTKMLLPAIQEMGVEDVVVVREMISVSCESQKDNNNYRIPSDELLQLYHCADIFVFPSLLETFGLVLLEAMAAGLPVVTTDAPGCRDVIENGKYGLMVKRGDAAGFADRIDKLINDEHFRADMVESGLEYVKKFDWDIIVDAHERLYLSLIKQRSDASI